MATQAHEQQDEGEAPDPFMVATLARMDLQARELGRVQERNETLTKTNRALTEEITVLKIANQQYEKDVAMATREMTRAMQTERTMLERAQAVEAQNKELRERLGVAP